MVISVKKIWRFFISIRLTIFLLILLSGVCVVGTVVPQNEPDHVYTRIYSPSTYAALRALGVTDLYHAWWFVFLLATFTLNLIACSLHRLPRVLHQTARANPILTDEHVRALPLVKRFKVSGVDQSDVGRFAETFRKYLGKPTVVSRDEAVYFFSEKGRWAPFSFYLTHIGIVIIIAGVLIGMMGFQGFMKLSEGESSSIVVEKKTMAQRQLDFLIRCDRFDVTYYEKAGMPRDYLSTLTVIENGKEVMTKTIEVNDPLIYKGIYFYQSSYGVVPGGGGEVLLRFVRRGGQEGREHRVAAGERFRIDGSDDEAEVETILPDFVMDSNGGFASRSDEPRNPAARVIIYSPGKEPYKVWTFAQFPDFHQKPDAPYTVYFLQYYPRYYTGLQVTYDPGVWIVWVGCGALIFGICLAFFSSHRRIWLRITKEGHHCIATLAGTCGKNKPAFESLFARLYEDLKHKGRQS